MKYLFPALAAGLMASCHPAHAVAVVAAHPVAAHPVAARAAPSKAAPSKAAAPVSRPVPVVVPVPAAPMRRSNPCDTQPQPADCKR